MNNKELSMEFVKAIKMLAEKHDNMDNFECYLSMHFDTWMKKYAYDPESLTSEVKKFAEMEI